MTYPSERWTNVVPVSDLTSLRLSIQATRIPLRIESGVDSAGNTVARFGTVNEKWPATGFLASVLATQATFSWEEDVLPFVAIGEVLTVPHVKMIAGTNEQSMALLRTSDLPDVMAVKYHGIIAPSQDIQATRTRIATEAEAIRTLIRTSDIAVPTSVAIINLSTAHVVVLRDEREQRMLAAATETAQESAPLKSGMADSAKYVSLNDLTRDWATNGSERISPGTPWCEKGNRITFTKDVWLESDAAGTPKVTLGDHVFLGPDLVIGAGTQVGPQTEVNAGARIGHNVVLGQLAVIGENSKVGDRIQFGQGATVMRDARIGENTRLGDGAWVGFNTVVGANAVLGERTQVGSDTVLGERAILENYAQLGWSCVAGNGVRLDRNAFVHNRSTLGTNVVVGAGVVLPLDSVVGDDVRLASATPPVEVENDDEETAVAPQPY